MGITAITRLENRSSLPVAVLNIENPGSPGHGIVVNPGDNCAISMFIPWATDASSFVRQRLEVQVGGRIRFWIWQAARPADGDFVRFSTDGRWSDPGWPIHGVAAVDGDRTMVVQDDCVQLTAFPVADLEDLRRAVGFGGYRLCDQQPPAPRTAISSVPRSTAIAFSMAGTPSDAYKRGQTGGRFLYNDSGKRYQFQIVNGVVEALHPNGERTRLDRAISYDRLRLGERSAAPPFDMVAADGGRVIAKARGTGDLYFATMDHMFLHGAEDGRETSVPSNYFKIDPEANRPGAQVSHLTKHLSGCFGTHPAAERFPLFRLLLELQIADLMIVAVEPGTWHKIDSRPPLGPNNILILTYELLARVLAQAESWPLAPGLNPLREAISDYRRRLEQQAQQLRIEAPGASVPPAGVLTYPHSSFCRDGAEPVTLPSIDVKRVLDIGVGHAHWHEQYEYVTGGELQPLATGRILPEPHPPIGYAELYRAVNGPIRDGDGYIDGTCTFYQLAELADGRFALLYIDEQSYFTQRWRICSPDDHLGGGLALVVALNEDPTRDPKLYNWRRDTYWDPFLAGHINAQSRLAVSRQVLLVNGRDPGSGGKHYIYSFNFSHATMDRSWRWRQLPAAPIYYDPVATGGAEPEAVTNQGDVVYPQTIRLQEDMTMHLRGARRMADGTVRAGRWYQRYLPSSNQLVPPARGLRPNARPAEGYSHHWKFLPEEVFRRVERFSHVGVYDSVDSRAQYYPIAQPSGAVEQVLLANQSGTWIDVDKQLYCHAWKFWWAAPLRIPEVKIAPLELYAGPPEKRPPSIFNRETRLRIVKRGGRWIAMHADKRDDDLMPFERLPMTVRLRNGATEVQVTIQPNVWADRPPAVRRAHFWWEANGDANIAYTAPDVHAGLAQDNVWKVRMAAIEPDATDSAKPGTIVRILDVEREGRFVRGGDNYYRYRWTPTTAERALLMKYCSMAAEERYATSIWFEDRVGHVAPPEEVRWVPPPTMRAIVTPSLVPIGVPIQLTVAAFDERTSAPLNGTVCVDGVPVAATGARFPFTYTTRIEEQFDPETRVRIRVAVPPLVEVEVPDYPGTQVPLNTYLPRLELRVEPATVPVGVATQVIVRALDQTTRAPVAGRVLIGGADVGATNVPFTRTFSSAPATATVTAAGFPNRSIAIPLVVRSLRVTVEPGYLAIGRPMTLTVRAVDSVTGVAVASRVLISGQDVAAANGAFSYTSGNTHPPAIVRAPGYTDAAIPWPPLRKPRLNVTIQPRPIRPNTVATYSVRATDADSGALVDGTVFVSGIAVARTNAAFSYTFRVRFVRTRDVETGGFSIETIPIEASVSVTGYDATPIDLGV